MAKAAKIAPIKKSPPAKIAPTPSNKSLEIPVIYLLPSETFKVLVQNKPGLKISAFLPPKEREITFSYDDASDVLPRKTPDTTLSIETPQLVWTQSLSPNNRVNHSNLGLNNPSLNTDAQKIPFLPGTIAINSVTIRNGLFRTKPYTLSNVRNDGTVCFGDGKGPQSLRAANTHFWMTNFTTDLNEKLVYSSCTCSSKKKTVDHDWAYCEFSKMARGEKAAIRSKKCKRVDCDCCRGRCPCTSYDCSCAKAVDFKKTYLAFVQGHKKLVPSLNTILGTEHTLYPKNADGVILVTKKCGIKLPPSAWKTTDFVTKPMVAIGFVKCLPSGDWSATFGATVIKVSNSKVRVY